MNLEKSNPYHFSSIRTINNAGQLIPRDIGRFVSFEGFGDLGFYVGKSGDIFEQSYVFAEPTKTGFMSNIPVFNSKAHFIASKFIREDSEVYQKYLQIIGGGQTQ